MSKPKLGASASSGSPRTRIGGMASGQMVAGLYDLEDTLGEGHYAVVKSAKHVFTGERVAVKVINKMKLDAATRLQMMQEVRLMKLVQHPHVVRLYEVIDTQTKLYLILELADGGDMYDYIMKHEQGLLESAAKKYFRQIVHAIQYCHQLHVVHRDLKPENVVFFEKLGMVKLTDFGFSNKFDPGQQLRTSCGSLAYSAPEILLGDSYDAPAVDVWSLGVILYMLVCGTAPFQEANDSETLTMIMDCKYSFPSHISIQCQSLISRMLQRQPELRASLEDIVHDPWLETEDPSPLVDSAFMLPLVSRQHLKEEDHATILQKMVAGSIAAKDEIIEALDRNEYNHITATYFLLAERKLRAQRLDQANRNRAKQNAPLLTHRPHTLDSSNELSHNPVEKVSTKDKPARLSTETEDKNPLGVLKLRIRKCSIVEEDEEDVDEDADEMDQKLALTQLSLSSTNIPLDSLKEITLPLDDPNLAEAPKSETPTPFPVSSQIGSGNLSRQNSLRTRGDTTSTSSSPSSPPGSNASSNHSSPARFKSLTNRKLVSTRSSPQLMHAAPVLKEIHEEVEEGAGSPPPSTESFAASRAVMRRLEQRRKIRLHKNRAQSCSSSDASDDDSAESRKKREKHSASSHFMTRRENNNDDSSDNQDSGVGRSASSTKGSGTDGQRSGQTGFKMSEDKSQGNSAGQSQGQPKTVTVPEASSTHRRITRRLEFRKLSADSSADSSEWEDQQTVEKNPGLEILKKRLNKLRQEAVQQNNVKNNLAQENHKLARAHSCSSLFSLQQNLVRHRRSSCQACVVPSTAILDIFGVAAADRKWPMPMDCKKNSLLNFLSPTSCFDVC